MDKLNEPLKSLNDFYSELIIRKHNNEKNNFLRDRLSAIKGILIHNETNYIDYAKSNRLSTLTEHFLIHIPDTDKLVFVDEMINLYEEDFRSSPNSGKIGRDIYDYIKSLALDGLGPYCTTSKAGTVDHYLPKTKFPTYSITPANLVPCCGDCNLIKDTHFSP